MKKSLSFRAHPLFLPLVAIFSLLLGGDFMTGSLLFIVIIISIFVHEMGHALLAIFYGQKATITFLPFGGVTFREGGKLSLVQELLVIAAGPLASLFLAFATVPFRPFVDGGGEGDLFLALLLTLNLFWTAINLLPLQPLDGGKFLFLLLERWRGAQGCRIACGIALGVSAVLFVGLIGSALFLPAIILLFIAFENFRLLRRFWYVRTTDFNQELQAQLTRGEQLLQEGALAEARDCFESLRNKSEGGGIFERATYHLAEIEALLQRYDRIQPLLLPIESYLLDDARYLLFLSGRESGSDVSYRNGVYLFNKQPRSDLAFGLASIAAMNGDRDAAIGWLSYLKENDRPLFEHFLSKREAAYLSATDSYQRLVSDP